MPSGDSADPIYLSSDSEEGGDIRRGMLSAAAKGKRRATDTAPDADQGVEETNTENQTADTGGADISVNGTRTSTPVKPSSVAVSGVLPQKLQSSLTRDELNQCPSTNLKNQQGIRRICTPPVTPDSRSDDTANPLDPLQVLRAHRSARSTNVATMPTIAEDIDVSIDASIASTMGLAAGDNTKTDMAHLAQQVRRSLSIADAEVGAVNQSSTPKIRRIATEPHVYIPTPSPRPAFTLVPAPTPHQTNGKMYTHSTSATVSESHPNPSVPSASCSQGGPVSHQIRDASTDQPLPGQTIDLKEALRQLETKETHYESLIKQMIDLKNGVSSLKRRVEKLQQNQGQSMPSTTVANQSSPNTAMNIAHSHVGNAVPSRKRNKGDGKQNTSVPTPGIAANANAKKGKKKRKAHPMVTPEGTEPGHKMTKAERRAERKAERKAGLKAIFMEQQQALGQKSSHGFAPAFLEADQHPWEVYPERCIRPFNWKVLDSLPAPIFHVVEPRSSVQFPNPIFWTPSPSNPETIMRPHPQWSLGSFQNEKSPALSPRVLRVDNIPVARCNLRSLISWFQLFGALVYAEHAGSTGGWAILEYADSLGAWRAMTCEFPAWGDLTISAKYASLMKMTGYGRGREKGRTTMPLGGIRAGTSASDSMKGYRGPKRRHDETELEDGEIDAHFGIRVSPPRLPIAGPSRPSIMPRRWLTKIIDGQEYVIVDDDEDDPDIMVNEAPPINAATQFPSKNKKSKRRRPQRAVSRPETIKPEPMEVELAPPSNGVQMETSDREDEPDAEPYLQDEGVEVEYIELDSTEDEDENSSDSEASTVEIPDPEPSTMVGRMRT